MSQALKNDTQHQISLLDIVHFVEESWKKLATATIVGGILGLSGWFVLGSYSAEYVLLNKANAYGLNVLSWKTIQKRLPNLAAKIVEDGQVPVGQVGLYRILSNDQWWQKNVVPRYSISNADIKDLKGISKEFDSASTTIVSLALSSSGSSKEEAIKSVKEAAEFLRSGGAYLEMLDMLSSYEAELISTEVEIQRKIASTKIEMGYQQQRAKSLEELYKRYPGNSNIGQQVVDPKESGAKYLSITTQIIAANNDINQSKEVLKRMDDRLAQLVLTKLFLDEALPKIETTFDGLLLDKELLAIEAKLRDKIGKEDPKHQESLDKIRSELLIIQARFTKGLEVNTAPTSSGKKGLIKYTAGGLAGALSLMFLVLLVQRVWVSIMSGGVK